MFNEYTILTYNEYINIVYSLYYIMVLNTECKLYKGNGSYILSLKKSFIEDSGCSLKEGDILDISMVDNTTMTVTIKKSDIH